MEVGWHSHLEQEVVTNYGTVPEAAAPLLGVTKRADVVLLLPSGQRQMVDVAITHTPYEQDCTVDIHRVEALTGMFMDCEDIQTTLLWVSACGHLYAM